MSTSRGPAPPTSWIPVERMLLSQEEIEVRVDELAAQISRDYAEAGELLLVGVLRGAFVFLADLCRRLTVPCRIDFVALRNYDTGAERREHVATDLALRSEVAGRHLLVVEDIVDSGHTLAHLLGVLRRQEPASLRCCALLRKPARQAVELEVDYLGFELPDLWVVGYGLDFDGQHRALPFVGVVRPPTE